MFFYCHFHPMLNLEYFQRKCLCFYTLPTEIAISTVLLWSWAFCFTRQKPLSYLRLKELKESMECPGMLAGRLQSFSFWFLILDRRNPAPWELSGASGWRVLLIPWSYLAASVWVSAHREARMRDSPNAEVDFDLSLGESPETERKDFNLRAWC